MCGRYSLRTNTASSITGINCPMPDTKPRYNLCPSQEGIIVRLNEVGAYYASTAIWNFCPAWMKDASKAQANARGETIAEKPMFRDAFKKSRCLVILDSFFEWDRKVKPSQPYVIRRKDKVQFAVAGICATRQKEDGTEETNYAIITISPNKEMEPIHHRMPVILDEPQYKTWLNPKTDVETLKGMLVPYTDGILEAYKISLAVNRPANDSPDILNPL